MKLTKEEQQLVEMYRAIPAKWDRLAVFLIVQSLAWGRLTTKTDGYSVQRIRRTFGLK